MRQASKNYLTMPFFLTALLAVGISGCSSENKNTIEGVAPAPGQQHTAVLFHRNADAVRGESENISIVNYGDQVMNDIGNVYSARREATGTPQRLQINWRNSNTLQIFRDPTTQSYRENKHFECMTGIFIQTAPFDIEYGDIEDIKPTGSKATGSKATKAPTKAGKNDVAKHR